MVHIVFTANGFNELMSSLNAPFSLWLNADVVDASVVTRLRAEGWDVTMWANRFDHTDVHQLKAALSTVAEHHPEETLWVEQ
jgi:hypothetical protein